MKVTNNQSLYLCLFIAKILSNKGDRKIIFFSFSEMPFGMVPALELEDGRIIGQSNAIARYLARKLNLAGVDEEESLQVNDYQRGIYFLFFETVNS